MKEYDIYHLKNGIRVVHKEVSHTKIAHCGFILDVGTRDEEENQQGMAHFWEHMAFKGTSKRKSYHIINRLEVVGGELNAYTTKEKLCFYASILDIHYEKAIELLSDITFNSTFPAREIEKERTVILEEISMYKDAPEDSIFDDFENLVFGKHPLGYNILGTPDSIKGINEKDFKTFVKGNLDTHKLIFSSIGNIPFQKVKELADRYLSEIPETKITKKRKTFKSYKPKSLEKLRPSLQGHCIMGNTAFKINDERRIPFFMLVNILGGPAMNAKLNMALREKYGFVYNVEANYTPFIDTGLFSVYFATEKKHLDKSKDLVLKELKKMQEKPLGSMQLHLCKEQIMGQLAMAEESNLNFMQMMGKSLLDLKRIESLEEIFKKINQISSKELMELSRDMFDLEQLSFLTYIPNGVSE